MKRNMRKLEQYATLLCGCILALSACQEKLPEPAFVPEQTSDAIGFNVGVVKTKGLIETDTDLSVANTKIKVYDILTSATDENVKVTYIDDEISGVASGAWAYKDADTHYYWTKSGLHNFFGYMLTDPDNNTFTGAEYADQVLTVTSRTLTPATTPQIDFLYSDIVSRNAATDSHGPIALNMHHLFTALSATVVNGWPEAISISDITFTGLKPTQGATIDWGAATAPSYDRTAAAADIQLNSGAIAMAASEDPENPVSANVYTGQDVPTDGDYRLLWPQDGLASATVSVTFTVDGESFERSASLAGVFADNEMAAEKKYSLVLTLTYNALYVNATVADWEDADPLTYKLNMSTNMRLFDSWLYRYDTDGSVTPENYTDWATSHMVVSDGRVNVTSDTEPVPGRPLHSPQIQLVTTGSFPFNLVINNTDFEIVHTIKNATGVVTGYDPSDDGILSIPAGDDVYTYFYIVPKLGVTPADPVAKVSLIYKDTTLGDQKVTFNYNSLPGYSDDSSEIWVYYVAPTDYSNSSDESAYKGKFLKMYFQDYNNPLVPTTNQD